MPFLKGNITTTYKEHKRKNILDIDLIHPN